MRNKVVSVIVSIAVAVAFFPAFGFAESDDVAVDSGTTVNEAVTIPDAEGDVASGSQEDADVQEEPSMVLQSTDGENGNVSEQETPSYNIGDYQFTLSKSKYFYDGNVHMPEVICSDLSPEAYIVEYDKEYVAGEEYYDEYDDVWYQEDGYYRDPTGPGTYHVYIRGASPYTGSVELTYSIVKTSISLNKTSASIYRTGTLQLKAVVENANGKTTYKSSNTKVATVNSSGKVVAKSKGSANITVQNGFAKKVVKVTVNNPRLSSSNMTVYFKSSKKLNVIGKIGKVTFKSSNKKVAKVTKAGKVIAKKKGKCTITVKANGITLKCKVKVKKAPKKYVYITRTGKRYHCDRDCWGLRNANALYKVTLSKAKKKKLTPCHVCY